MPPQYSIFQIFYSVRTAQGTATEENWATAFCCSYQGATALVTARHLFMKAGLVPKFQITVRAVGDKWEEKNQMDVHVIAHPVADVAVVLPQSDLVRAFTPLSLTDTRGLRGGEPVTAQGFLTKSRSADTAPPLSKSSGSVCGPPTIAKYGRHQTVTVDSDMSEEYGLSGAPVFLGETSEVIGIYSHGVGRGTQFICASQIAEV